MPNNSKEMFNNVLYVAVCVLSLFVCLFLNHSYYDVAIPIAVIYKYCDRLSSISLISRYHLCYFRKGLFPSGAYNDVLQAFWAPCHKGLRLIHDLPLRYDWYQSYPFVKRCPGDTIYSIYSRPISGTQHFRCGIIHYTSVLSQIFDRISDVWGGDPSSARSCYEPAAGGHQQNHRTWTLGIQPRSRSCTIRWRCRCRHWRAHKHFSIHR